MNKLTNKKRLQRCFNVDANTQYFNVDINNVRQRQNNLIILNVEFCSAGKRQNNVVEMTVSTSNRIPGIHVLTTTSFYCLFIYTLFTVDSI